MPKHTQTYLDGYQVQVAVLNPEAQLTDVTADVELIFHNEDHSDVITVPIPADVRGKLAAYLVGMTPADPVDAMAEAKAGPTDEELDVVEAQERADDPKQPPAGRCSRCGARDAEERAHTCPNVALIQVGDIGAMEGFAESGCQAAMIVLEVAAEGEQQELDPPEHADIDDEADHGPQGA